MRPNLAGFFLIGLIAVVGVCSPAGAVTLITDRATFESLGVIDVNFGFEDQPVGEVERPFATHGVDYGFNPHRIVEQDGNKALDGGAGLLYRADIDKAPMYTMFGFDVTNPDPGNSDTLRGQIQYEVGTNVDPAFNNPGQPAFMGMLLEFEGTRFIGLIADPGEHFTDFLMAGCSGILCASTPTIDNVTLGHVRVAAVPEPATLVLYGIAMAGFALLRKRIGNTENGSERESYP